MKRKEALKNLLLGLGAIGLSPVTARGEAMAANEATRQKDGTLKKQSKALHQSEPGIASFLPKIVLNEVAFLAPGLEYNIFNKNVFIPEYGMPDDYDVDYIAQQGRHLSRGYRYVGLAGDVFQVKALVTSHGESAEKVQTVRVAQTDSGAGITRNVLIVGDSTIANGSVSTSLASVFSADPMNINLIGTRGSQVVKHEGRGGWTTADYYGQGRLLYIFNLAEVNINPSIGAVYSSGGVDFTVTEVNISGGKGYISCTGNAAPPASGMLTKVSGNGDSGITFQSSRTGSQNPFYNPSSQVFDFEFYLSSTGQNMGAGDWVFFTLGINDVFNVADVQSRVREMISQTNHFIKNIHAFNAGIRIGITTVFPPANQDAFGRNYNANQNYEDYRKRRLLLWQQAVIENYDGAPNRDRNVFIVPTHCNLDCDYNYPIVTEPVNARNPAAIVMQSNAVHPNAYGYAQIADMYAGLIKYFG